MNKAPVPGSGSERADVYSCDALEQDCQRLANLWGGPDYRDGLIDGVALKRGTRELNDPATTAVTFMAERVRLPGGFENYFTVYTVMAEVEHLITKLPANVRQQAIEDYGEKFVNAADELMEVHQLACSYRDDSEDFQQGLAVSYIMDGLQIEFDVDAGNDSEAEPDGEAEEIEADEPELPAELALLNDAWELIAEAGKKVQQHQLPFDLTVLRSMARIDRRLNIQENTAQNLFSLVRLELRSLQIKNCQGILKKLSAKERL